MNQSALDADVQELRRLARLKKQLEPLAKMFARHAPATCRGTCEEPTTVLNEPEHVVCCNLRPTYDRYHDTVALLREAKRRVELGRQENAEAKLREQRRQQVKSLAIAQEMPRDYTDTHIRMKRLQLEGLAPLTPQEHLMSNTGVTTGDDLGEDHLLHLPKSSEGKP